MDFHAGGGLLGRQQAPPAQTPDPGKQLLYDLQHAFQWTVSRERQ